MRHAVLSGWMLSLLVGLSPSAESADAPRTTIIRGSQPATTPPAPTQSGQPQGPSGPQVPQAGPFAAGTPNTQQRDQEMQRQRELLLQQQAYANRPTEWQLQNPSGISNRSTTSPRIDGYVAPNTYFGPNQRTWTNLSGPVVQQQLPANISPTVPLTQTNVMIAPYNYYGAPNSAWSNVTTGGAAPSPLGGWNYRLGW